MADVTLTNLHKRFDRTEAVSGIDLEIKNNEFVVLVGPSGCGKSTTLRMIAGLEEVTEGEILIGGELVNDVPPKDRDIAMVFQNYALYPHMTVFQNMSFGLRLRKYPKDDIKKRVEEAAEVLGLNKINTFFKIKLPIAIRQSLPAYGNEMILMLKGTSLASTVTLLDLTGVAKHIISTTFRPVEVFIVAGSIYLLMTFIVHNFIKFLEKR